MLPANAWSSLIWSIVPELGTPACEQAALGQGLPLKADDVALGESEPVS